MSDLIEKRSELERETFIPKVMFEQNEKANQILQYFKDDLVKICFEEIKEYDEEKRSLIIGMMAIRILKTLNVEIQRNSSFRHTKLD